MTTHYYLNIEHINQVMKERGISEEQLAAEIGVTKNRLHGYLIRYRKKVPFIIFVGLRIALDIPFNELITTVLPSP